MGVSIGIPAGLGSSVVVGSRQFISPTWWGLQFVWKTKILCMYPLKGSQDPPPNAALFFLDGSALNSASPLCPDEQLFERG